jgi:hypothetical protein
MINEVKNKSIHPLHHRFGEKNHQKNSISNENKNERGTL